MTVFPYARRTHSRVFLVRLGSLGIRTAFNTAALLLLCPSATPATCSATPASCSTFSTFRTFKFGTFGTYWHTMEDTPDKVSAESLGHVGRLVELGLRTNAFIIEEPSSTVDDVVEDEKRNQSTSPVVEHQEGSRTLSYISMFALCSVIALLSYFEWTTKRR